MPIAVLSAYPVTFALKANLSLWAMAVSRVGSRRSPTVFSRVGWEVGWTIEKADWFFSTHPVVTVIRNYVVQLTRRSQRDPTVQGDTSGLVANNRLTYSNKLRDILMRKHRQRSSRRKSNRGSSWVIFKFKRRRHRWYRMKWTCGQNRWRLAYIDPRTGWSRDRFGMNRLRRRSSCRSWRKGNVVVWVSIIGVHCLPCPKGSRQEELKGEVGHPELTLRQLSIIHEASSHIVEVYEEWVEVDSPTSCHHHQRASAPRAHRARMITANHRRMRSNSHSQTCDYVTPMLGLNNNRITLITRDTLIHHKYNCLAWALGE